MVGENDFETLEAEVRRLFPEEVQGVAVAFFREVERNLAFLENWGFHKSVSYKLHKRVGYSLRVDFHSTERDREVTISHLPKMNEANGRESISVLIWKDIERVEGRGWDGMLNPYVFLERFHPEFDLSRLQPTSYEGPVEERLRRCLSAWASVFQNELRAIILGEDWVDGMYVTPFD
jgi:hypothetical protein